MTVGEAIAWVDRNKHNLISREDKIFWLFTLESLLTEEVNSLGDSGLSMPESGAFAEERQLLLPPAFCAMYLRYLEYQIDYVNQDYRRSNNALAMLKAEKARFDRWLTRTRGKELAHGV